MPKKEPQLNNPEPQALKMARQALRRANEMDLTPQQKNEVMAMIDQAKALEKSNPHQALKIYTQLKQKLEVITTSGSKLSFEVSGEKMEFDLNEELKKSEEFFEEQGVDWVNFPQKIHLNEAQIKEFERCVREYGFNRIMIIPAALAEKTEKRAQIHKLMTQSFRPTEYGTNYPGLDKVQEKRHKVRLVLYNDEKENNIQYLKTVGKTAEEMSGQGGLLDQWGLEGMSEAEYLAIQRQYFLEHGNKPIYFSDEVMLLGNEKFVDDRLGGPAVITVWRGTMPDHGVQFDGLRTTFSGGGIYCALVKTFDLEG